MEEAEDTSPVVKLSAKQANNLLTFILSVVLGVPAIGGFYINHNQWNEVTSELKSLRQELGDLKIKLMIVERNAETTKALELQLRETRDKLGQIERSVFELNFRMKDKNPQ